MKGVRAQVSTILSKKNPRNLQKRAENMEIPQIPSYIVGGLLPGGPQ